MPDKKVGVDTNSDGVIDYNTAEVVSANDYYPGGMDMPGLSYSISNTNYRYGFNGKEKDNRDGVVQYDYGFRIYDPRLVRFKSVDPLTNSFPWYTPYQFAGNKPIWAIDLDGLEEYLVTNYYDRRGRIEETLITTITNKETGDLENLKLKDANGHYLAEDKKVLILETMVEQLTNILIILTKNRV